MAKQPYIPLYIGDWEQDLNCVSLEAEGAALKLIFKLWNAPARGLLRFCYNQLSVLFKKSDQETRKIMQELIQNRVFDVEKIDDNTIEIKSRRMVRDVELSRVRKESGRKGGNAKKEKNNKNPSKTLAKPYQKHDNENGIGIENEIGNDLGKSENLLPSEAKIVKLPPSPAMVETMFQEAGLTTAQAKEFFDEVEGRFGWQNINDYKKYTLGAIAKRLKPSYGNKRDNRREPVEGAQFGKL